MSPRFPLILAACLSLPSLAQEQTQDARRQATAVATFMRQVPCPATKLTTGPCPGYVVEHIRPLCFGGSSSAGNLQWNKVDSPNKPGRDPCRDASR